LPHDAIMVKMHRSHSRSGEVVAMFSCTPGEEADSNGRGGCVCCGPHVGSLTRRVSADISRRGFVAGMGASLVSLGFGRRAAAQTEPSPPIVFTNFLLFDGQSGALRGGLRLLIEGDRIRAVAAGDAGAPDGARIIDCGGRTVMPGLIDAHWHTIFAALPVSSLFSADVGYIFLAASAEAERTLMRGFTTVRDLGGPPSRSSRRSTTDSREGRASIRAAP
jgi:hypothetical protein